MTIYIKRKGKYIPLIHEADLAEKTDTKRATLRKRRSYHSSIKTLRVRGGTYYLFDEPTPLETKSKGQ